MADPGSPAANEIVWPELDEELDRLDPIALLGSHEELERCCCKLDGSFPVALLNPCGALARLIDLHLIIECLPATGGLFYCG